jgi:alpha-L-rhamnosidase
MFGDFIAWAYQYIAGIRLPDAEGSTPAIPLVVNRAFSHVLIAPDPVPQLSWAKASVDGPNGKINVSWKVLDGDFLLEVALTGKVTATVRMPDGTEYMAAAGSSRFTCPFGSRRLLMEQ